MVDAIYVEKKNSILKYKDCKNIFNTRNEIIFKCRYRNKIWIMMY